MVDVLNIYSNSLAAVFDCQYEPWVTFLLLYVLSACLNLYI